jgi:hypothetical protein
MCTGAVSVQLSTPQFWQCQRPAKDLRAHWWKCIGPSHVGQVSKTVRLMGRCVSEVSFVFMLTRHWVRQDADRLWHRYHVRVRSQLPPENRVMTAIRMGSLVNESVGGTPSEEILRHHAECSIGRNGGRVCQIVKIDFDVTPANVGGEDAKTVQRRAAFLVAIF